MDVLYLLIPLGLIVMAIAIGAFLWAIKSGQYDDLEGPAHRILMDDDDPLIPRKRPDPSLKQEHGSDNIRPH
ncbi:MAG: cbb3-type cytochrome oxidase assembly protein CcoS [Gammaproteobacteria bacterium]|nr:cbb3-type cytochrome oxidase assembly protein CcoS [Gammaproteobacteria bacterium]